MARDYDVLASVGHIRDLPKGKLGVDIENGFAPTYVVPRDKQKTVTQIRKAAAASDTVLLATDPDREGEAIAWHLMSAADLDEKKTSRVRFHEITKSAVRGRPEFARTGRRPPGRGPAGAPRAGPAGGL